MVITFPVTHDFALTPAAERFYSTFHAAKCRTPFRSPHILTPPEPLPLSNPIPALFPFYLPSSSVPRSIPFFAFSQFQPFSHHCFCFLFCFVIFFCLFFLGLHLYLLTIIMYISQSGSGTSQRGALCARFPTLRGPPSPPL